MAAPRSRHALSIARAACAVLAVLPVVLLWSGRSASAQPGDLFDEIYRRGQSFEQGLRTVKARFTESSTSRLLKEPLVASGVLAVDRQSSKIALHYQQPEARTILIDGNTMRMEWPSRGLSQKKDVGATMGRIQKYFVGASPKELRSHFEIEAEVDPKSPAHWLVRMTPTRRQIKEGIARIDLRIAQESSMLTSMRITFPNGDTKTMTFEDVVTNEVLEPGCFRVHQGASGCFEVLPGASSTR
jgi:outer membrane lipoprotein-sorting protein